MALNIGAVLNNRYKILSILGQGGMGAVYRAQDQNLGILVAVKENLYLTEEYARQFEREAKILASMRQPNMPRVIDYFTIPGQSQFLIMDFIDGEDLRQRIERLGILSEQEVILIGAEICDALDYLHNCNPPVVHRDIKPGNIKITPDGEAYLVDFGLAKVMRPNQETTTGARAMTPGYSPPEQYGTAPTDPRSDIYSLAATLYAALTGTIPEDGLARATGKAMLTPLRQLLPRSNARLANAIENALAIDSDERFQTAEEFKLALLEAGDLGYLIQDKPRISPPPEDESDTLGNKSITGPGSNKRSTSKKFLPRQRKWFNSPAAFISITSLLIALVALVIIALPNLVSNGIPIGWAQSSKTTSTEQIPIAATLPPTITPSFTPSPTITVTITPSPEPTITNSPSPQPTATPLGGGFGQIAFASNRTGNFQIWLMNADGTQQIPITNMPDGACQPSFSPDGKKLAFISPCRLKQEIYDGSSIYILEMDTNNPPTPLPVPPNPAGDFNPAWSPDGNRIAFTSLRGGRSHIYLYNFGNNTTTALTNTSYADKQPAWSPDGTRIAFIRTFSFSQLWTMSDAGQYQAQFVISGDVDNLWPSWSSDGYLIFYSQMKLEEKIPWLVSMRYEDRGGLNEKRIPPTSQADIGPIAHISISPDGQWIAYESWPKGENHDIYIMTLNGANQSRLTTDRDFDFDTAWRPGIKPAP